MKNTKLLSNVSALLLTIAVSSFLLNEVVNADEVHAKAEVITAPLKSNDEAPGADLKPANITATTAIEKLKGLPLPLVSVYKSATCGCCAAWVDHMKDSGFLVETHNAENLNEYKIKAKLGAGLGSCHTAFVDGYAIEGHVPADDVKRLLIEKPEISGLTAPGMPMQSPGMAPKGSKPAGYDVISFKDGEAVGIFSKY